MLLIVSNYIDAAAYNEQVLLERESLIQELRDSVTQSAQHVRNLQQQLIKTTDAVIDTGGEQSQVCYALFFAIFLVIVF